VTTQRYYDAFSAGYDDPRGGGYHALIDELETRVVLAHAKDADVLEVGCGTGLILGRIDHVARRARGVDLSPGMAAKAAARGLDVALGSATALPFADASFDLAYSFKVLAHVPAIEVALAEMARVVRPGGHVVAELYNPLSLRYLARRAIGPRDIGGGRTEADVYTRWDLPWDVPRLAPPTLELVDTTGIRVFTPAAFVHRVPVMGSLLRAAEARAMRSPLRVFGGFYVATFRRR